MPSTQTPRSRRQLPDPLGRSLRATEATLRTGRSRRHCLLCTNGPHAFDVEVAKPRITRAVKLMRRLLEALLEDGCKVAVSTEFKHPTIVSVDGQAVQIRLRESWHQSRHVLTVEEERRIDAREYVSLPGLDYRPSGVLHLEIMNMSYGYQPAKWSDETGKPLERQFGSFVKGLHQAAAKKKADLAEQARAELERYETQCREDEARRRREADQKRFDELLRRATRWEQAELLRNFLDTLEARMLAESGDPNVRSAWFQWARERVENHDPLEATVKELLPPKAADLATPSASS